MHQVGTNMLPKTLVVTVVLNSLFIRCYMCQDNEFSLSFRFPSSLLLTTTEVVPTWAVEMALATPTPTTFNLADASALALAGISTTRVSFVGSKSQPIPSSTRVGSSSERSNPTSTSASSVGSATPTKTELTHPVPAHRNMLPTAAIIGIVLGTCFIVLSLAILLVLLRRRRRRQQQADFAANPYPVASSHTVASIPRNGNAPDNSDTRSITTVRRQYLRNELRAAQEKIVNIEESETRTISMRATQSSTPGRLLRLISTRSASSTGSGLRGVVSELRDRNEALTARIRELEAQMESPWALGLSNDPPPGYSEEGP
ncbi:hypothetical protein C8R44DRAFT_193244 [Mycena epipterygia]|nr:hypothetical protein C8R44DRAFT_193244 [Mycena epipterygia]